jgi:hypothetical protein
MPQVQIAELGSIGLAPDAIPQDLPPNAWTGGRNVVFRDGTVQRVRGHVQFSNTPAVTPYYVTPYQTATARFWVHAGIAAVYADDGATLTDITGTAPTGTAADRWSGGTLNGVLVMNNGVDVPTFWGGDTGVNLATLTGWDANWRAACIRPWRNQLVALDVTKSGTRYPHMVKLSASAVPGAIPTVGTKPTRQSIPTKPTWPRLRTNSLMPCRWAICSSSTKSARGTPCNTSAFQT